MNTSSQKLSLIHWITELEDDTTLDVLSIVKEQTEVKKRYEKWLM
jgi:hypothetical protein